MPLLILIIVLILILFSGCLDRTLALRRQRAGPATDPKSTPAGGNHLADS